MVLTAQDPPVKTVPQAGWNKRMVHFLHRPVGRNKLGDAIGIKRIKQIENPVDHIDSFIEPRENRAINLVLPVGGEGCTAFAAFCFDPVHRAACEQGVNVLRGQWHAVAGETVGIDGGCRAFGVHQNAIAIKNHKLWDHDASSRVMCVSP